MPTNETKRRLAACGMFVLPLVLVQATAVLLGGGSPAPVAAAPQPVIPPALFPAQGPPSASSESGRALAEYVRALRDQPFGPVPLYYPARDDGSAAPESGPAIEAAPEWRIQAVMAAASGNIALINGKARRVGDIVGESGWVIVEIDPQTRSVTIEDPRTHRRDTRSVKMP